MTMLASQITSLTVVFSIVYSGVNQRKHQSSASLAFVREIHRGPVNFPHKWPVTRKMFPFDDVIMFWMQMSSKTTTLELHKTYNGSIAMVTYALCIPCKHAECMNNGRDGNLVDLKKCTNLQLNRISRAWEEWNYTSDFRFDYLIPWNFTSVSDIRAKCWENLHIFNRFLFHLFVICMFSTPNTNLWCFLYSFCMFHFVSICIFIVRGN